MKTVATIIIFFGLVGMAAAQTTDNSLWICIHEKAVGTTACTGKCSSGKIPYGTCGKIKGTSYGYWSHNFGSSESSFWVFDRDATCSQLGRLAFTGNFDCNYAGKCSTIDSVGPVFAKAKIDYGGITIPFSYDCNDASGLAPIIFSTVLSLVVMAVF